MFEQEREIPWSDDIIGVVDSSFFWGYIITQIPGGIIASRLPAHRWESPRLMYHVLVLQVIYV